MSRDRYAAAALNLIHLIDADNMEATGRAIAQAGLTMHEAATNVADNIHRAFDSFPRPQDADVAPEPRCLQELHQCD